RRLQVGPRQSRARAIDRRAGARSTGLLRISRVIGEKTRTGLGAQAQIGYGAELCAHRSAPGRSVERYLAGVLQDVQSTRDPIDRVDQALFIDDHMVDLDDAAGVSR